jgi:phosphomevalonate kinase
VSFLAATYKITGIFTDLEGLHRDAQLLNAFVQEKVGSGFDISCSVYGSQLYRRFKNVT